MSKARRVKKMAKRREGMEARVCAMLSLEPPNARYVHTTRHWFALSVMRINRPGGANLTTMMAGLPARFFFATTAADYGENFCNELYDEFCAVRDGLVVAPTLLPVIYEVPQGADWKNERNWKKANPNLGCSGS